MAYSSFKVSIAGTTEKPRVGLDGFRVRIVSLLCLRDRNEDWAPPSSKKKHIISRKRCPIAKNTIGFAVYVSIGIRVIFLFK